jgi:hypothetical protein
MVSDSFISGVRSNPGSRVLESLVVSEHKLAGASDDGLWILDSFSIFLRFEISENFSYDDRVIEVSVIEVHIGKEGS